MTVNGTLDRKHEVVFGDGKSASDYYKFRVEDVYEAGYCLSENLADFFYTFNGEHVLFHQCFENVVQSDVFRVLELG